GGVPRSRLPRPRPLRRPPQLGRRDPPRRRATRRPVSRAAPPLRYPRPMIKRLCVQWPRFGPYHLARLAAPHRPFASEGVELIGLETATDDRLYGWAVERGPSAFRREQVFPGRVFDEIPPREMAAGVHAALDRLNPDAVGIHSYSLPDARACLAWCRRRRRVAVLMYDSNERDAPRVGWREAAKRLLVSEYDAALVAGHPQGRYAVRLGIPYDRVFYGYDVVDNAYFA